MNDATRHHLHQWGFEEGEIDAIAQLEELNVDIALFTLAKVNAIDRKVAILMADVTGLEAAIAALTGVEEAVITKLNSLAAEISTLEAGSITQETIDSLTGKVTDAVSALGGAISPPAPPAEETPPAEPPAEEPPAPPAEETPPAA